MTMLQEGNNGYPPSPLIQAPVNLGNQVAMLAVGDKTPFTSFSEIVFRMRKSGGNSGKK